jgi:hypothetical protein
MAYWPYIGKFLFCLPVHGYAQHGDLCTAGCETRSNFAVESVCLMAINV